MRNIILFLIPVIAFFGSCEKDDVCNTDCDQKGIVSDFMYGNAPADPVSILETEILGDCLRIKFGSSGCSGESWKVHLVASEMEYFSIPPQRDLRLSLENPELCEAYITREITFDVKDLRTSANMVQLNIVNGDTSVIYEY